MLGLIAGIVTLRRPGESLLALVLAAGIWLIVAGIAAQQRLTLAAGDTSRAEPPRPAPLEPA